MFDLARFAALAWALVLTARARRVAPTALLVATAYVLSVEWASGMAVRHEGPMEPAVSMLLILVGPSILPRGHLVGWPFASLVVRWPAIVDAVVASLLVWVARALSRRASEVPAREEDLLRALDRETRALTLCAVVQAMSVLVRALPALLGGELGRGRLDLWGGG